MNHHRWHLNKCVRWDSRYMIATSPLAIVQLAYTNTCHMYCSQAYTDTWHTSSAGKKCGAGEAADKKSMASAPLVPFCTNCLPPSCMPGNCQPFPFLDTFSDFSSFVNSNYNWEWGYKKGVKLEECVQICKDMQDCTYIVHEETQQENLGVIGIANCYTFPAHMMAHPTNMPAFPVIGQMDSKVCSCCASLRSFHPVILWTNWQWPSTQIFFTHALCIRTMCFALCCDPFLPLSHELEIYQQTRAWNISTDRARNISISWYILGSWLSGKNGWQHFTSLLEA